MFYSTRHRIASTTVKPLLSSNLWHLSPWHRMPQSATGSSWHRKTRPRAHDLDLKYRGSAFTQVLESHGKDGRYLVLVVGPFANLSDDFMVLCDFLGRARALKAIYSWNIDAFPGNEPAHILVSHFGHLASLVWAKLILGRFPNAVLPDFSRFPAGSNDHLNAFFTDTRHGRYCGRYVPGALDLWTRLS